MSPDHDSPYYCPIHGIKAMLTEEGVTGNWDNLEKAKVAVEAHLIRCTAATKIAKLPGLSATVHGYIDVVQVKVSTGGALAVKRLLYLKVVMEAIDLKIRSLGASRR